VFEQTGVSASASRIAIEVGGRWRSVRARLNDVRPIAVAVVPAGAYGADDVHGAPFALAYIATATLLLEHPRLKPWMGLFAPVGRMALTNYLSQTLICIAIYYYGGLFGSFRPALGLLIACSIFMTQIAFSSWWLSRYRFGPMEWLWRSMTYGHMQPVRIPRFEPVEQPC
jgi:uncharacterized membrane protein YeiB